MKKEQVNGAVDGQLPGLIIRAEKLSTHRYVEYFVDRVRNPRRLESVGRGIMRFVNYCEHHGVMDLSKVEPKLVSDYVAKTKRPNLAAIRILFDWLVVGKVIPWNPAKFKQNPELTEEEADNILDFIEVLVWSAVGNKPTIH
jgi:hypothetical protein